MKIKINDVGYAYDILNQSCDGENVIEISGLEYLIDENCVAHHVIGLPDPLKSSVFICQKKDNGTYFAGVCIEANDMEYFDNTSRELERKIALGEEKFFKTGKNGTGYIIDDKLSLESSKDSSLTIAECDEGRIIAIGCRGSRPRILSDKNSFMESIEYIEKHLNNFLEVVYKKFYGKTKNHHIFSDVDLYSTHNLP